MAGLDNHRRGRDIGWRSTLGLGIDELAGIGMLRRGKYLLGQARFNDLAIAHDGDAVGHVADDAEIVGDEQERHARLAAQFAQELEYLSLDGDVERRGRLVGDQEVGIVGEGHGDHHALALAAGKLMRKAVEPRFGIADADQAEQLDDAPASPRSGQPLMQIEDFADLALDRVQRIERGHRFLEHHGDVVAPHLPQVALIGVEQFGAAEADRAGRMAGRGIGKELEDRQSGDRLAGPRFADQRQGLALGDREGDALDGMGDG